MAEYIERTEELVLAVNAGARAIENNKRYHGAIYNMDVFSNEPKEIPYLKAAEVLRTVDAVPAADVVEVVRCAQCKYIRPEVDAYTHEGIGYWCSLLDLGSVEENHFCNFGERRDNNAAD